MAAGAEAGKPVRKRRPQERAEATRRKLVEVALKEFSERGFDAVTVRDIEGAAGVQRNLLSYHFGNKEEMWKAAAAHVITKLQDFQEQRQDERHGVVAEHKDQPDRSGGSVMSPTLSAPAFCSTVMTLTTSPYSISRSART